MLFLILSLASSLKLPLFQRSSEIVQRNKETSLGKLFNNYNNYYYTQIEVGTPGVKFAMLIDTGSSVLWVPNFDCTDCTNAYKFYDPQNSTTSLSLDKKYAIRYGQNNITGSAYKDVFKLEKNLTAENVFFLSVFKKYGLKYLPSDGILGLPSGKSIDGNLNIVDELKKQGQIQRSCFSIYLNDHMLGDFADTDPQASIIFGGIDNTLAISDWRFIGIYNKSGLWISNLNRIQLWNMTMNITSKFVSFSTSSSTIIGPKEDVDAIMKIITKKSNCYAYQGYYICSCQTIYQYPPITFNINGKVFRMNPQEYVVTLAGKCWIQLQADKNVKGFILGLPFLRKYYTFYQIEEGYMGFALAKPASVIIASEMKVLPVLVSLMVLFGVGSFLFRRKIFR